MKRCVGRDEQYRGDYLAAQAGAASHLDMLDQKTADKKTKIQGNFKEGGLV